MALRISLSVLAVTAFLIVAVSLALCGCQSPAAHEQVRPPAEPPEHATSQPAERLPDLDKVIAVLSAIRAELVVGPYCSGDEEIEIALTPTKYDDLMFVVYRVPDLLQVFRYAFYHGNGLAVLESDLGRRDTETYYAMRHIPDDDFKRLFDEYPIKFKGRIGGLVTADELRDEQLRAARGKQILRQP